MKRLLFSSYRIEAMILRYWFLLRSSWPRVVELIYWPVVQMILWGFISNFMATNSTWVAQSIGLFLGAVLLWDIFFRSQLGVSLCFLEEIWSHNLGHLLITPLRWYEWVLSLFMVSFLRTLISNMPAVLLAIVLFNYSLFELGWALSVLILNLIMVGWWLGSYQRITGATILLASHNMKEVERLCSMVLMMRQGRIVDRGSPHVLLERYGRQTLEQVFLDIARQRRECVVESDEH